MDSLVGSNQSLVKGSRQNGKPCLAGSFDISFHIRVRFPLFTISFHYAEMDNNTSLHLHNIFLHLVDDVSNQCCETFQLA